MTKGAANVNSEQIGALRMTIGKQALVKAVELSQRGLNTDASRDIGMCMETAHQLLESVYEELTRAQQTSDIHRLLPRRTNR